MIGITGQDSPQAPQYIFGGFVCRLYNNKGNLTRVSAARSDKSRYLRRTSESVAAADFKQTYVVRIRTIQLSSRWDSLSLTALLGVCRSQKSRLTFAASRHD